MNAANDSVFFPSEYNAYFFDSMKPEEAGVAIYSKAMPKAIMTGMGFLSVTSKDASSKPTSTKSALVHSSRRRLKPRRSLQEQKYRFMEGFENHLIKTRQNVASLFSVVRVMWHVHPLM